MIDGRISEHHKQETESLASGSVIRAEKDITIKSSGDINQEGSEVQSRRGDINYEAGEGIRIKSAENVYMSKEKKESYNASYTFGTGGYSANAGFSIGGSRSEDIWQTNSTVRAAGGKISMSTGKREGSEGEMLLKGGNILGSIIELDVKGGLSQESVQDSIRRESKTIGLNAGLSGGTGISSAYQKYNTGKSGGTGLSGVSVGGHYGRSKEDSAWVGRQTSILGRERVSINAGGKYKNKGAVIANADYVVDERGDIVYGKERGKLGINAKGFEYEDIKDHAYKSAFDYGIQISAGKFDKEGKFAQNLGTGLQNATLTGSFYNQGSKKEQITKATLGKGDIKIDGKEADEKQLSELNREIRKSQEITREEITRALNAELTVDTRFVTSIAEAVFTKDKGIKDISVVEDLVSIYHNGGKALEAFKEIMGLGQTDLDKFMKLLTKEPKKLTREEKEFIENILEDGKRRYIENALETGNYETLMMYEQEKARNNKVIKDEVTKAKIDSSISSYVENETGTAQKPISEEYFKNKQEEYKKQGNPFCNMYLGEYLSRKGIYIPRDYANNLYDYMAKSNDWADIGLDHKAAQHYAEIGLVVIGTYKDKNTPIGGRNQKTVRVPVIFLL